MKKIFSAIGIMAVLFSMLAWGDNETGTLNINASEITVVMYKGDGNAIPYTTEFLTSSNNRWYHKVFTGPQALQNASVLANDIMRSRLVTVSYRRRGASNDYDVSTVQVRLKNY
ncbi:MAG: hypothetical protein HYY62_07615 [Deltaproteobacteria bacterium]|nr:hypothetical protein [Deltaproteobacteria bacterium]